MINELSKRDLEEVFIQCFEGKVSEDEPLIFDELGFCFSVKEDEESLLGWSRPFVSFS